MPAATVAPSRTWASTLISGDSFLKYRDRERQARDHAGLPRDHHGMGVGRFRDGGHRGDIAGAAEIFVEGALHGLVDGERGQEGVGVQQRG